MVELEERSTKENEVYAMLWKYFRGQLLCVYMCHEVTCTVSVCLNLFYTRDEVG